MNMQINHASGHGTSIEFEVKHIKGSHKVKDKKNEKSTKTPEELLKPQQHLTRMCEPVPQNN